MSAIWNEEKQKWELVEEIRERKLKRLDKMIDNLIKKGIIKKEEVEVEEATS
jgi:predicted transcriptional regulator